MVIDDFAVEDDVRTVGGDDPNDGLITQIVLSSDDEVDLGRRHLRLEFNGLRITCGCGYSEDFPTLNIVFFHQADHAAFGSGDVDLTQTGNDHFGVCHIHDLGHLRVNAQEGVAVGSEHGVGDVLVFGVVRPGALGKEIFTGNVTKSGHPVAGVFGIRTVVGHKVAVEEVVHTPNEGVVDEGVRGLGGAEHTHGTGVLAVVGAAHPGFAEAFGAIVEFTCKAVDGHDERHLAHVVHLCHMAVAHCGLTPTFFQAMVAVLQPESASVDGINHLLWRATGPATEFTRGLRDVANTIGTEVVDYHRGVLVARPLVARCTAVNAVDSIGVVAVLAHVATEHL